MSEIRMSVSALGDYLKCGERFRRRRIENEWRPFGLAAHIGTAAHEVGRLMHRRQIAAKEAAGVPNVSLKALEGEPDKAIAVTEVLLANPMLADEAADLAATEFDKAVDEKGWEPSEDDAANPDAARGAAKDAAIDHSKFYAAKVGTAINPVSVERMIEVTPRLSGEKQDAQITLRGIIDLIDGSTIGEEVVDRKTSYKAPRDGSQHGNLQMSFYAALRLAETKALPPQQRLEYTVRSPKLGKMSQATLITSRTKQDVKELLQRVQQTAKGITAGVFMPADPDQWWCSKKFCEFYGDCKYTVGRRSHEDTGYLGTI